MKHLFVINPKAGKGKSLEYVEKIKNTFYYKDEDYEIVITEGVGHATEIVRERTKEEECIVYAIGGDGTLNEVLNGMINSNSKLAIIPSGSGNDFVRTIFKDDDINILSKVISGEDELIDVAKINDRYYINISSVGFDAVVVNNARKYKKKRYITGSFAYLLGLIEAIIKFRSIRMKFEVDGETFEDEMYLIAAANGRTYGGGLKIAPLAEINDGFLEIYAIKKPRLFRLIRFIPRIFTGKDTSDLEEVRYFRCKKFKVCCEKDAIVNIDGELTSLKEIEFEIIPKAVKLVVPKKELAIDINKSEVFEGGNLYESI